MIESSDLDRFPLGIVVTLQAIGPQSPLMLISMTVGTSRRNTQKCPAEILDLDRCSLASGNTLWRVASIAAEACVSTLEFVSRLSVIEDLEIPFRQDEILAVVFGVAVQTLPTRTRLDVVCGVQASSRSDARSNLIVTSQALEYWFTGGDFVATNTVGHTIDRLVCA
jgi:hypothetical protein